MAMSLAPWALGNGQPASATQVPDEQDRAAVCAVSEVALATLKFMHHDIDDKDRNTIVRLQQEAGGYTQLPKKIRCGREVLRLVPLRYGTYMHSYILSHDRKEIVISGGYQASSLDGASGDCLFRLSGGEWHSVACRIDTVS